MRGPSATGLKRILDSNFSNFDVSPFAMDRGSSVVANHGATFRFGFGLESRIIAL